MATSSSRASMSASSSRRRRQVMGNQDFLKRIEKSLYYGKLPSIPCLSLPVMELSSDIFSKSQKGKSLKRLYIDDAAELTRNACVSPCSLVLALVYLERLKTCNPDYVANIAPTELFLVSLMVSNKFLQDDGEEDEVFPNEWAASAGISSAALIQLERKFLHAIDWRVFVNEAQFEYMLEWLEQQIAFRQAKFRGWFTYTDLTNINSTIENIGLLKCLVTVYMALSISYIASIYTLVASSFIVSQSLITLTASNQVINVFSHLNHNNKLLNIDNTSYIFNNVYDTSANLLTIQTNMIKNSHLNFLQNGKAYAEKDSIKNEHNLRTNDDIDYFKPLRILFIRDILQWRFFNKCKNVSNDPYSCYGHNMNDFNDLRLKSIHRNRDNCVVNLEWIKSYPKSMLC